jgi:hypothetical protein
LHRSAASTLPGEQSPSHASHMQSAKYRFDLSRQPETRQTAWVWSALGEIGRSGELNRIHVRFVASLVQLRNSSLKTVIASDF